jgi:hypothetical protein
MNMVLQVWNNDEQDATRAGVQRCWRKAHILPPGWNQGINNEVGSASMPENQKQIGGTLWSFEEFDCGKREHR